MGAVKNGNRRAAVETREILPLCVRAEVAPKSIDPETRTVDVVFSTGAPVMRTDFWSGKRWVEKLAIKPESVRLERLNAGAPVLDAHSSWSINDQIGVVMAGSAKIVGKEARATVQFSKRDAVEPIWRDIQDGIIRNVSVGYRVHKFEETVGTDGKLPVRTAVDWEPYEISMVPMPADMRAQVRGGEKLPTNPCAFVSLIPGRTDEDRMRALRLARAQAGEAVAVPH